MKTTFNATVSIDIDIQCLADTIEDLVLEKIDDLCYEKNEGCADTFFPAVMTAVTEEIMERYNKRGAV